MPANLETITGKRAMEIIEMNRKGEKPLSLEENGKEKKADEHVDLLAQENINRFDKNRKNKKRKPRKPRNINDKQDNNNPEAQPKQNDVNKK